MGKKHGLGRSLVRDLPGKPIAQSNLHAVSLYSNEDWSRLPVRSITHESGLAEFFNIAELANQDFKAGKRLSNNDFSEKKSLKILTKNEISGIPSALVRMKIAEIQLAHKERLKVPRRPQWKKDMSTDQLETLEKEEFLKWRRALASLEQTDGIVLTPFEKNLEFWRQLWRVIERSNILVQIIDARQPLLYYCEDLETYAHEVDPEKVCVVLVNKSDFLTEEQRVLWANYFNSVGVYAIFWSALLVSQQVHDVDSNHNSNKNNNNEGVPQSQFDTYNDSFNVSDNELLDSDSESVSTLTNSDFSERDFNEATDTPSGNEEFFDPLPNLSEEIKSRENIIASRPCQEESRNLNPSENKVNQVNSKLVGVEELLNLLTEKYRSSQKNLLQMNKLTIGFVGYPNVGKSSTLNAILGHKKVAVSITPGKTKHFQTVYVRPDLMLCDCPGLVMPSFAYSRADLVVAGILSVDEMRDFLSPIGLVCEQIPRTVLEAMYGITLPKSTTKSPTPHELLAAHAFMHGFMTSKGNPNYDRSARIILKDYISGCLLYCHPPPDFDPHVFQSLGRETNKLPLGVGYIPESKVERFMKRTVQKKNCLKNDETVDEVITEFDRMAFAQNLESTVHVRSHKRIPVLNSNVGKSDFTNLDADETCSTTSWNTVSTTNESNAWSCTDSTRSVIMDETIRKPWRILSHAKQLNSVQQQKQKQNLPRMKKRKEKLRRVYGYLDQHEKT